MSSIELNKPKGKWTLSIIFMSFRNALLKLSKPTDTSNAKGFEGHDSEKAPSTSSKNPEASLKYLLAKTLAPFFCGLHRRFQPAAQLSRGWWWRAGIGHCQPGSTEWPCQTTYLQKVENLWTLYNWITSTEHWCVGILAWTWKSIMRSVWRMGYVHLTCQDLELNNYWKYPEAVDHQSCQDRIGFNLDSDNQYRYRAELLSI